MSRTSPLDELAARVSALFATGPAHDIDKNLRALLAGALSRLDVASREEFEIQRELLARARQRLTELEARVAELEARKRNSV